MSRTRTHSTVYTSKGAQGSQHCVLLLHTCVIVHHLRYTLASLLHGHLANRLLFPLKIIFGSTQFSPLGKSSPGPREVCHLWKFLHSHPKIGQGIAPHATSRPHLEDSQGKTDGEFSYTSFICSQGDRALGKLHWESHDCSRCGLVPRQRQLAHSSARRCL